jgi:hypothetical protein
MRLCEVDAYVTFFFLSLQALVFALAGVIGAGVI